MENSSRESRLSKQLRNDIFTEATCPCWRLPRSEIASTASLSRLHRHCCGGSRRYAAVHNTVVIMIEIMGISLFVLPKCLMMLTCI